MMKLFYLSICLLHVVAFAELTKREGRIFEIPYETRIVQPIGEVTGILSGKKFHLHNNRSDLIEAIEPPEISATSLISILVDGFRTAEVSTFKPDKMGTWLTQAKFENIPKSVRVANCAENEITLTKSHVCVTCRVYADLEDNACRNGQFRAICPESWMRVCVSDQRPKMPVSIKNPQDYDVLNQTDRDPKAVSEQAVTDKNYQWSENLSEVSSQNDCKKDSEDSKAASEHPFNSNFKWSEESAEVSKLVPNGNFESSGDSVAVSMYDLLGKHEGSEDQAAALRHPHHDKFEGSGDAAALSKHASEGNFEGLEHSVTVSGHDEYAKCEDLEDRAPSLRHAPHDKFEGSGYSAAVSEHAPYDKFEGSGDSPAALRHAPHDKFKVFGDHDKFEASGHSAEVSEPKSHYKFEASGHSAVVSEHTPHDKFEASGHSAVVSEHTPHDKTFEGSGHSAEVSEHVPHDRFEASRNSTAAEL